ncbi:MAG: aromatic ring-hydroxylating dioxygenase subunit alpha [Fulvivirga sp.]|nr:aromatic ring-hydroxylating dioxygenase subunit alpha [Fulvivirga sp.]
MSEFYVDPDITKAETLPASFYRSETNFELLKEKVFLKTWQWVGDQQLVPLAQHVHPFILLDNFLTEPLVLTRDEKDKISCLSNVCTHRGNMVVQHPGKAKKLQCLYHGRRFNLQGAFQSMPEFDEARDFPRACDNLPEFPLTAWGPFLFVGLEPVYPFQEVIDKMNERVGFLPLQEFVFDKSLSKEYLVNAHWALYCDNYLEGFHIPFVHEDLNKALDYGSYTTEIYDYFNLQIGFAQAGDDTFDLPQDHIDYGKNVAAYYYWVFPNMMFNFYPWGLSVNIVRPQAVNRTRVSFLTYVYDENKLHSGAGALLDKVEREDEFVVEGVFKGIQSRFYKTGRFSPKREKGVHHFHRLLADFMNNDS